MNITVELLPAIRFDCNLCSNQSWHTCTMRTGMEAVHAITEKLMRDQEARDFVQKIRRKLRELDLRLPPIPDFTNALLIEAKISCKTCGSRIGSENRGFTFICDDCGRHNYFLPENDSITHVECEHCGSKFKAEHFMSVMRNERQGAG